MRYAEARRDWLEDTAARAQLTLPELQLPAAGGIVSTIAARAMLEEAGVRCVPAEIARTPDEAVSIAQRLGYPVALKIESPDIPHKTEAQGVQLGLADATGVAAAYASIVENAWRFNLEARLDGVIVQPMAQGDVELVIGLKHDPAFGVVIMVGLGGIHIEILRDVVFRKAAGNTRRSGTDARRTQEPRCCTVCAADRR